MALSYFDDKARQASNDDLSSVLGRTWTQWKEIRRRIAIQHRPVDEEWTFAGKNYGWSLRLKRGKRAILYLTPRKKYFRVAFVLGEKAVEAARDGDLPPAGIGLIEGATRYAEGRGLSLEIRAARDLVVVEKLAAIKLAH